LRMDINYCIVPMEVIMDIDDTVLACVNGGIWTSCKLIDTKDSYLVVAGQEEIRRAAKAGRNPIGVSLPPDLVKKENSKKPLDQHDRSSIECVHEQAEHTKTGSSGSRSG
jgi:hypothetical protein